MNAAWTYRHVSLVVAISAISACSTATSPSSSSGGKYDGTYDFSETQNTPTGTTLFNAARYFTVANNVVSSSDGALRGGVTDNFGNVTFSGPCPVNGGGATFTGILNAGNPKFGQGKWVCAIGGATNTWRV
ncbi:MAG TPA: hypothetical protein VGT98_18075, partial [Candidatus Elarobacter sp.]|nr:hypothetical protein [Candidatus Elarobacter sp.]